MNFITIGDQSFFRLIDISIRQARRFYPESTFFVYDFGFAEDQRAVLEEREWVRIVDWRDRWVDSSPLDDVDWVAVLRLQRQRWEARHPGLRTSLSRLAGRLIGRGRDEENAASRLALERFFFQKPYCIRECLAATADRLVWLDGDAFLYNTIHEVFDGTFDVGLTVRRLHQLDFTENHCLVVNAGVLFFDRSTEKTLTFVDRWIEVMRDKPEYCADQTALTRLVQAENAGIFQDYHRVGTVRKNGVEIAVKTLPCDTYNCTWIEEDLDPAANRILHFKAWRHADGRVDELLDRAGVRDTPG